MNMNESKSESMWQDRNGRFVPISLIKEYEQLREQQIDPLIQRWIALYEEMADLKANMFDDIEDLLDICAYQYGVTLAGKKGNISLYKFDGSYMLQRKFQNRSQFDERLLTAEQLIRSYIDELAGSASDELKVLILGAFERNKDGEIRRHELVRLRALDINDERWRNAMDIIAKAEQIIDSACYVQVHKRVASGKYEAMHLDFSAIIPKRKK